MVIGSPSSSGSGASTIAAEGVFLPLPAAPVLADGQPGVGDAAAQLLIAQTGQHQVAAALLGIRAARTGQQILAEVIDAQHEAADRPVPPP